MRGHATKRRSDMRFVVHCALLLFAFVGLATVVDRWTAPATADDNSTPGVRRLDSGAEAFVPLHQADSLQNQLHLQPLFLVVLGLVTVAVYRPGLLRHCKLTLQKRGSDRKAKGEA